MDGMKSVPAMMSFMSWCSLEAQRDEDREDTLRIWEMETKQETNYLLQEIK